MSIQSKYDDEERKNMELTKYMRESSLDDILNLSDKVFRVAVLIRESTASEEQKRAFDVQKNMVLELIEKKDNFRLEENNIFEELGKSGLRAADRPAFQLMCSRARKHAFDILVVDAVSRLARNQRELHDVIDDFKQLGIGIIILKERYWTFNMDYTDTLRLGVAGGLAQAESMNTGRRVENHMAQLARDGQLLGGDLFGYRLKKATDEMGNPIPKMNSLVQEPTEAYVVKKIFELYISDDEDVVLTSSSICKWLIDNKLRTFNGDLNWTPSKVIRILANTKYMGKQLPEKSKIVDTVSKKKVLTKKEPIRDQYDSQGNIVKKGNLVDIPCDPIVSENDWWKAYNRRMSRSSKNAENIRGRKSGLRVSTDAMGRKVFCSCGYCLSRQYTHVATATTPATYRYKCRWQIDHASKYTIGAVKPDKVVCTNPAVSDVKLWFAGKKVFQYLFKNGKAAVLETLNLINAYKQNEVTLVNGSTVSGLEEEREKLRKRLKNLQTMLADELLDVNDYKEQKTEIDERIGDINRILAQHELDEAKREKKLFDMEAIKDRLDTAIDLSGFKVNEEMLDLFLERVIYRGIVDGADEFLWVINLSGSVTDTSAKYRINGFDKSYSDYLKNDSNFNIVSCMMFGVDEQKNYCENIAHRRFKAKYWRPMVIKIAIQADMR